MKRRTYELLPEEAFVFRHLRSHDGAAWTFWRQVAKRLGIDVGTILAVPSGDRTIMFSALPTGHGKHWCWPSPLICPKPRNTPPYVSVDPAVMAGRPDVRRAAQAAWNEDRAAGRCTSPKP